MSLVTLAHARRSNYPSSAKLHGGGLGLSGGGLGMPGGAMTGGSIMDGVISGLTGKPIANRPAIRDGGIVRVGRGRHRMKGGSWWSNIGDKIKGAFNSANDWLKKTKVISTVAKFIPNPYAKGIGMAAGLLGYGRYHNRVKGYTRKTGAVRKYTRRVPRKKCHCGSGRGCGCRGQKGSGFFDGLFRRDGYRMDGRKEN
jgi:hypothetical protein